LIEIETQDFILFPIQCEKKGFGSRIWIRLGRSFLFFPLLLLEGKGTEAQSLVALLRVIEKSALVLVRSERKANAPFPCRLRKKGISSYPSADFSYLQYNFSWEKKGGWLGIVLDSRALLSPTYLTIYIYCKVITRLCLPGVFVFLTLGS
jgi:hypothetical protein